MSALNNCLMAEYLLLKKTVLFSSTMQYDEFGMVFQKKKNLHYLR